MKCKEIIAVLEKLWPMNKAVSWDNVGLQVGSYEKEVHGILLTLDITDDVLHQAVTDQADMIISHHPLIFSGIKSVTSGNFIGSRVISLIQHDMVYYAMHTNYDVVRMGQMHSELFQLKDVQVLSPITEGAEEGIGCVGILSSPQTLQEFAEFSKEQLGIPQVSVYGDATRKISRVAVSGGSGKSMVQAALLAKADVLVTGDIDHHTGIDCEAQGLAVVDGGHYGTEYLFMEDVKTQLEGMLSGVAVKTVKRKMPYWVL
jgi:dinuclear metal center YbgI/SA1388 family protein